MDKHSQTAEKKMSQVKLIWFSFMFLLLGCLGLAMSLCGGWFALGAGDTFSSQGVWLGLLFGIIPGAFTLFFAREAFRRAKEASQYDETKK
jgi:hypothetical protein